MRRIVAGMLALLVAGTAAVDMASAQSGGPGSAGSGASSADTGNSRGDRPGPQGGSTLSTPGGAAGGSGTQGAPGTMSQPPSGSVPSGSAGTPGSAPSGGAAIPGGGTVAEDQETIRAAQQQLQAAGFTPGPVDGVMDDQTRTALREFQRSRGLQETGQLDQETRSSLFSASGTPTPSYRSK